MLPRLHSDYATMSQHNQEIAALDLFSRIASYVSGTHPVPPMPKEEFFDAFFARFPETRPHRKRVEGANQALMHYQVFPDRWAELCAPAV